MAKILKRLWTHTKIFFFTVGLISILLGILLMQIEVGERHIIWIRPKWSVSVTASGAVGMLLIGFGILCWAAIIGALWVTPQRNRSATRVPNTNLAHPHASTGQPSLAA